MRLAGPVNFKRQRENNDVPVCYQLAGDLFCWGIDSDSAAIEKQKKKSNLEQIVCQKKKKMRRCTCPEGRSGAR